MSRESWLEEFLPIIKRNELVEYTPFELVDMCIAKYRGLLSENVAKHDATVDSYYGGKKIVDEYNAEIVGIYSDHCPLCIVFDNLDSNIHCEHCPLHLSGNNCCRRGSIWANLADGINDVSVNAMIEALEKSKKFIK